MDALPKKISQFIERFDVLLELLILGYLFMQEMSYYLQLAGTTKRTDVLRLSYDVAYIAVPIGGALMIISMLFGAYQQFIAHRAPASEEKEVEA